jgi:hypothetical protein
MKRSYAAALILAAAAAISMPAAARADNPGTIDAYVTPFYNSSGDVVHVGKYSAGLASSDRGRFVGTIQQMRKEWMQLSFPELYVAAIRLYDMGYRNEATYWFYSAQYAGRQFQALSDTNKLGAIGSKAFELYHAQDAFFQLTGTDINGYAFGNIDAALKILEQVRNERRSVPDVRKIYPGVTFLAQSQWAARNSIIQSGLGDLEKQMRSQKSQIASQRAQNGTQTKFGHLTSIQFPGGF